MHLFLPGLVSGFFRIGVSADFRNEWLRCLRHRNLSVQNILAVHTGLIERLVGTAVGLDNGAVQAHTGKDAAADQTLSKEPAQDVLVLRLG
jgi:hypothetical protein